MVTMQNDRDVKFAQIMHGFADGSAGCGNKQFLLTVDWSTSEIKVRELGRAPVEGNPPLVAYSSTKADFQSSLEEFVWDYFTEET